MNRRWQTALLGFAAVISTSWAAPPVSGPPEHSLIVHFTYGSKDLQPLFALEDKLEQAIAASGTGEFDGDEIASDGSDGYLYMYGTDADRLLDVVKPILESAQFMRGAQAIKRYGPPEDGVREATVTIAP